MPTYTKNRTDPSCLDGAIDVMRFQGLKAPPLDVPVIELESPGGQLIDLYNEYDLDSVALSGDLLVFLFVSVADGASVAVQFQGVRDLRVIQPEGWIPEEARQIDHLLVRTDGPWPGVVFKAGGLHYEFDCTVMVLARS